MSQHKGKVIKLPPTPTGYADCIILILTRSTDPKDRAWAREQVRQAFRVVAQLNPDRWGKE